MPTGTQKFLAQGPVDFARTHPIVPDGNVDLRDDDVVVRYADESRHEIRPHHRLRTATLTKQNDNPTADKHLAYLLTHLRHEPGAPIGGDSFLTWYLPWNPGGGQVSMPIPELLDATGFGCVFGSRSGAGEWAFYLQENARVFYRRGAGGPLYKCANRALRVSQIYPARAVVSTNDAPKPLPIT